MEYFYEEDLNDYLDRELGKVSLTKHGYPRLRKPKEPRVYFTQETEDAIICYLSSNDQNFRNKIYKREIEYSFYKLVENIIHTFKFYHTDIDTIEELKHEVITFLMEKLHLFNHSKNINDKLNKIISKEYKEEYSRSFIEYTNNAPTVTQQQIDDFISTLNVSKKCREAISDISPPKAYSYFGTIAKRYLIIYNNNNYKKLQEYADMEEIDENENLLHEEENKPESDKFIDQYIQYIDKHLNVLFPKKQDAKTADAIIELFRKRETLEIFNKKALYIYIREITDTTTPHITRITKKLDTLRTKLYNEYYQHGYISGI